MNTFNEKDQLTRELHDRSHDIDGHPIGLESVKQSARKIQRRRRVASGAVAAAVLAVAVPTALAVTNGVNQSVDPVSPNPTPTPTVRQSAAPRPDGPVQLATKGLPRGEDPQVNYIRGESEELVTPDGTKDMPLAMQGITPYGDGWVGLGYDSQGAQMFFMDSDLQITDRVASGDSFTISPDGSQVAYVQIEEDDSQTLVNTPPTSELAPLTWPFPKRPAIAPRGFMTPDTVLYQSDGGNATVGMATADGQTRQLEGFVKATGASMVTGLVAGQTRSNPDASGCFGVMDPASSTSKMLWDTCDYSLSTFSPGGQFVLASDPYLDGAGTRSVSILDARTGDLVVTYQQERDSQIVLRGPVWESNDTVVSIAQEGTSFTFLRMSTAGDLEAATDPFEGDPMADVPYRFASMS